jgi:uncharacterized membrane protein YedE/YeeE
VTTLLAAGGGKQAEMLEGIRLKEPSIDSIGTFVVVGGMTMIVLYWDSFLSAISRKSKIHSGIDAALYFPPLTLSDLGSSR